MKTGLILGINGDLGGAISKALKDEGYNIFGSIFKETDSKDGKLNRVFLDMGSKKSIDSFIRKLPQNKKFDFFTNTIANKLIFNKFEDIKQESFEEDFKINVLNFIYILKKILPRLNPGANIIIILSEVTIQNNPKYYSSYVSSKYALLGLMKSLSGELKSKNIKINSVSPGMMDTKFIRDLPDSLKNFYVSHNKGFVSPIKVSNKIMEIINSGDSYGINVPVLN